MTMSDSAINRLMTLHEVANVLDEVMTQYGLGHDQQAQHLLDVLIEQLDDAATRFNGMITVERLVMSLTALDRLIETDGDSEIIQHMGNELVAVLRNAE